LSISSFSGRWLPTYSPWKRVLGRVIVWFKPVRVLPIFISVSAWDSLRRLPGLGDVVYAALPATRATLRWRTPCGTLTADARCLPALVAYSDRTPHLLPPHLPHHWRDLAGHRAVLRLVGSVFVAGCWGCGAGVTVWAVAARRADVVIGRFNSSIQIEHRTPAMDSYSSSGSTYLAVVCNVGDVTPALPGVSCAVRLLPPYRFTRTHADTTVPAACAALLLPPFFFFFFFFCVVCAVLRWPRARMRAHAALSSAPTCWLRDIATPHCLYLLSAAATAVSHCVFL